MFPIVITAPWGLIYLSEKSQVIFSLIMTIFTLDILMFIIYKGEYVYWINGGPTFNEAKASTSEKRKQYAKAHLDIFLKMTVFIFLYAILSLLFKLFIWIDIVVFSLAIAIASFKTVLIRFEK
ncbi:hypothetical protein [Tissierella creatinophila]|uniref:DUF3169 domain-containing protein n=1 Tax=Tissierella creatinophila DSM 6911 TaxID=1123403 RepID=A0A1U7M7E9_TISCR|nr:hypothetical protein [Tissierella creatinophila]OLS03139.1 hypothetical protein TICRE_08400 [Tissierella creatinophila DSM 6911]